MDDQGSNKGGKGMERGEHSRHSGENPGGSERNTNQTEREKDHPFVRNGLLHFDYKASTSPVTVAVVTFAFFVGSITLIGFLAGSNRVIQLIFDNTLKSPYSRTETLGDHLKAIDEFIYGVKIKFERYDKLETDVRNLEGEVNDPNKRKAKK